MMMSEDEKKAFAFILKIVRELSVESHINSNDMQQIQNLCDEYGTEDLKEDEFRY